MGTSKTAVTLISYTTKPPISDATTQIRHSILHPHITFTTASAALRIHRVINHVTDWQSHHHITHETIIDTRNEDVLSTIALGAGAKALADARRANAAMIFIVCCCVALSEREACVRRNEKGGQACLSKSFLITSLFCKFDTKRS
jgi:hypothetical protein